VVANRPEFNDQDIDMYLEGSDQHRGWFMSSLMLSTATDNKAPYKQVLTHGFTVDGQGRKMSKSIGNIVTPQEVMDKFGGDILRLWVASTDYTGEMTVSDEILKRAADSYRRIRNTARFLLANLNGFDPQRDAVKPEEMISLDRWAVACALDAQKEIKEAQKKYDEAIEKNKNILNENEKNNNNSEEKPIATKESTGVNNDVEETGTIEDIKNEIKSEIKEQARNEGIQLTDEQIDKLALYKMQKNMVENLQNNPELRREVENAINDSN